MTLVKWSPRRSLFNMGDELFNDFFNTRHAFSGNREGWYPAVDVTEDDNGYHFEMELPGLSKEDVKISFKTVVGAKSLVVSNLEDLGTYARVPVSKLRKLN